MEDNKIEKELENFHNKSKNTDKLLQELNELYKEPNKEINEDKEKLEAESRKSSSKGMAAVSHIISGVGVGALLGYSFDHYIGTGPWAMVIMIIVGFISGMVNMVRSLE